MADETQLDRIERQVNLLTELLTGNGDPKKGVIVRLARVEWALGLVAKILTPALLVLISAALAFIGGVLFNQIEVSFHHGP